MSIFKWIQDKKIWSVYFIFMLLTYIGYVSTDIFRYSGIQPSASGYISPEDLEMKNQLASWSNVFEVIFLALFIVMFLVALFKRKSPFLLRFFIVNVVLVIGILLIGVALLLSTTSPIGNLLQPLLLPSYLLTAMLVYIILLNIKNKMFSNKETMFNPKR